MKKNISAIVLALILLFGLSTFALAASSEAKITNAKMTARDVAGSDFALRYFVTLEFDATTWGNITIDNYANVMDSIWWYENDRISMQENEIRPNGSGGFGLTGAPSGHYKVEIITQGAKVPYFKVNGNLALDFKGWLCYIFLFGWLFG